MVRMVGTDLLLPWWIFSGEDIIVRGGLHLLYVRHLVSCQTHATLKRKVFHYLESEVWKKYMLSAKSFPTLGKMEHLAALLV